MPTCTSRLSFSTDTLVQTPGGEQPIASLQVGDHVTSYDPTTGKATTQTIQRVFINQDSDRLDVTLALPASSGATPTATAAQVATTVRTQRALVLSHGRRGPPDASTTASSSSTAASGETIHTTANHPWLTADRGWVVAGQLHADEPTSRCACWISLGNILRGMLFNTCFNSQLILLIIQTTVSPHCASHCFSC